MPRRKKQEGTTQEEVKDVEAQVTQAKATLEQTAQQEDAEAAETQEVIYPFREAGQELVVAISREELEALKEGLAEAEAKAKEHLDGWQRSAADFANYRRRAERDQATANQIAAANVIRRYLDIVDDLDRALKNRPQDGPGAALADGIDLIYRKFLSFLEMDGVKVIQPDGQFFDPACH